MNGHTFLAFYNLREQPFGTTPNPRFMYSSAKHREAIDSLVCGIENGTGFSTLISEPGMGKTMLLFQLLNTYSNVTPTAFVFRTQCNGPELLCHIAEELGFEARRDDLVKFHCDFNQFLADHASSVPVLLVIDEAQNLTRDVLETIRLLSDFETPDRKLLHIILSGQQQLADKLETPELEQLRQRIFVTSRLCPLSENEVAGYIAHRLQCAGYRGGALFSTGALAAITEYSRGIPRLINSICFNALVQGAIRKQIDIGNDVVEEVASKLSLGRPFAPSQLSVGQNRPMPERAQQESTVNRVPSLEVRQTVAAGIRNETASNRTYRKVANESRPSASRHVAAPYMPRGPAGPDLNANATTARTQQKSTQPPKQAERGPVVQRPGEARGAWWGRSQWIRIAAVGLLLVVIGQAGYIAWRRSITQRSSGADVASPTQDSTPVKQDGEGASALRDAASTDVSKGRASQEHASEAKKTPKGPKTESIQQNASASDASSLPPLAMAANAADLGSPKTMPRGSVTTTTTIPDEAAAPLLTPSPRDSFADSIAAIAAIRAPAKPAFNAPRGSVSGGKLISAVQPVYPDSAKRTRIQGDVTMQVDVDPRGRVSKVKALSGNSMLANAAESAVRHWRYQPFMAEGKPIGMQINVVVQFRLPQ